jgi:hypothetical protein
MKTAAQFVAKGISAPREGVREQGLVHAKLAREHAADLASCGWSEEDTAGLEALTEALSAKVGEQIAARNRARDTAAAEKTARANAKELISKLRLALPLALSKSGASPERLESFQVGDTLGRSTPKIAMYLAKILPAVEKLDAALAPCFGGRAASQLVRSALEELDAAQGAQESSASIKEETRAVYEAKGRLLDRIEMLTRTAKIAFYGSPELIRAFDKRLVERARRKRKKKAEEKNSDGA